MRLVTHHLTSNGGRRGNEDALKVAMGAQSAILVMADGLGGHGGGDVAAQQCVETIVAGFCRSPDLTDAVLQALVDAADRAIAALRRERRAPTGSLRTTLALLAVCGDEARWAHVGDSRIYWFRRNVLMQRTRDHSVAELVMGLSGNQCVAPPDEADRNRLLRAVGAGTGCRADLGGTVVTLRRDDAFLLCSDGVWGILSDPEITACLSRSDTPQAWCAALEQELLEHVATQRSAEQDNYSMIAGMVVP